MTLLAIVVALGAAGAIRLYRLAFPGAPHLAAQAERWQRARARATRLAQDQTSTSHTLGGRASSWIAHRVRNRPHDTVTGFEKDLAIVGVGLEEWLTRTLVTMGVGFVAPFVLVVLFRSVGVGLPLLAAPALGVALAAAMVVTRTADLRAEAGRQREDFRRALSIYLDLVVMSMEAGRGHSEALPTVAGIGTGWAFTELRDAVVGARTFGVTAWEALGRLGERYGLVELLELRATLALAQEEGGRVRQTLIARSQTMRDARLGDAQSRANRATDAMRNNLVLMAMVAATYVIAARILFLLTA